MKITCTKRYNDIPFAHRQPKHAGHCRFVHGHNWGFEFEFAATELDDCGFVIDFGGLKDVKRELDHMLDHKLVLNEDDPLLEELGKAQALCGDGVRTVPDCSCEGLARYVFDMVNSHVMAMTNGRVSVVRCTCFEDSKNSATVYA